MAQHYCLLGKLKHPQSLQSYHGIIGQRKQQWSYRSQGIHVFVSQLEVGHKLASVNADRERPSIWGEFCHLLLGYWIIDMGGGTLTNMCVLGQLDYEQTLALDPTYSLIAWAYYADMSWLLDLLYHHDCTTLPMNSVINILLHSCSTIPMHLTINV